MNYYSNPNFFMPLIFSSIFFSIDNSKIYIRAFLLALIVSVVLMSARYVRFIPKAEEIEILRILFLVEKNTFTRLVQIHGTINMYWYIFMREIRDRIQKLFRCCRRQTVGKIDSKSSFLHISSTFKTYQTISEAKTYTFLVTPGCLKR